MATAPTKSASPKSGTTLAAARVPYTNCAPFFHGWPAATGVELTDVPPRQFTAEAEAGRLVAGPMPLADFLRLQDRFERLGNLGIAVRGRCGSTQLFSRRPIRQLDDAVITVSDETSTTALLLRLILEQRYQLVPKAYQRGRPEQATDAVLLIGDEALKFHATTRTFPFEVDISFEWWLWQHLSSVFAVWVVRKDCSPEDKQRLLRVLQHQVAVNLSKREELVRVRSAGLNLPAAELSAYLSRFIYRFSDPEEQAIKQFEQLVHAHHVL